jgi:intracellular sulfur oxidation DsrE/DsrF family protein
LAEPTDSGRLVGVASERSYPQPSDHEEGDVLELNRPAHRRGFLGSIAATAGALGLTQIFPRGAAAQTRPAQAAKDGAYQAWLNRIAGRHKMVFDAPEPNGGMPVVWPRVWLDTTNATYGTTDAQNSAVVILRHGAIGYALSDAAWAKYKLGELFKVNDGSAPATKNGWIKPLPLPLPGTGIEALLAKGVLFGACNVALTVYSGAAAQSMGMDAAAVKEDWIKSLIPGIQVVPSGVLAVSGTQEKGCVYCFAG